MSDPLDRLIAAGWGDVPGPRIPAEVRAAAERGAEIPRYGEARKKWARLASEPTPAECVVIPESTAVFRAAWRWRHVATKATFRMPTGMLP